MKQSTGHKRGTWFWVGIILLSISVIVWSIMIPNIIEDPKYSLARLLFTLALTSPLIGLGIFGVLRGRKVIATKRKSSETGSVMMRSKAFRLLLRFASIFLAIISMIAAVVLFNIDIWYWGVFCVIIALLFGWLSVRLGGPWPF
jgi:hypothetical protein